MVNKTPLYDAHIQAGAMMVPFAGRQMPMHYGSQLEEHHFVRQSVGVFDVSHMNVVDLSGTGAKAFLQHVLANDVVRCQAPGKAIYSCMLNEQGCVIDDLIVYGCADNAYRLVLNAATHDKDMAWLEQHIHAFDARLEEQTDLAMLAVQGPQAETKALAVLPEAWKDKIKDLKPFTSVQEGDWFVARTGYTGEDGFEIMLPGSLALDFWNELLNVGVKPCGLGARDTLRLEAGMSLYGQDMDESVTPWESNLGWTLALDNEFRDFVGRGALEAQVTAGFTQKLVGLILQGRGVLRQGQRVVIDGLEDGIITSGSFSPTLQQGIALARVPYETAGQCAVEIRGKLCPVNVVKPPFVRFGQPAYKES